MLQRDAALRTGRYRLTVPPRFLCLRFVGFCGQCIWRACYSTAHGALQGAFTTLTRGFTYSAPVGVRTHPGEPSQSPPPNDVGFTLLFCGYSVGFPTPFSIHQCAKSIINLMRLTVTLCMIVDVRVLPSGTTLYSTSATDKSPVRARHTPTNRTTVNHPSDAAMRPDSDPRQSRRTRITP